MQFKPVIINNVKLELLWNFIGGLTNDIGLGSKFMIKYKSLKIPKG
jgi:hypothetical protein